MSDVRLIVSTIDDAEQAKRLARRLVENRLAACVNIIPKVISVYKWQGAIEESSEFLLFIKTRRGLVADLMDNLVKWHPYEVPEAIVLDIETGHPPYLEWVAACLGDEGPTSSTA